MVTHEASAKGTDTNRRDALANALKIYKEIERLSAKGFTTYTAIARELHRRGFRGSRGGRITRERIYEIRTRLRGFGFSVGDGRSR
jgi:hypothetical protein